MSPSGSRPDIPLAVIVPVLGRPHRVEPTIAGAAATTPPGTAIVFVADPDDVAELAAIDKAPPPNGHRVELLCVRGNYATKVNTALAVIDAAFYFTGADDLEFRDGWLDAAMAKMTDEVDVVGTQDLCNPRTIKGWHATHFLLARTAAECRTIDGERGPLCERYAHNCVDDELIATATRDGRYAFADDAVVAHLHPMRGATPMDATYEKGQSVLRDDRRLWRKRTLTLFR